MPAQSPYLFGRAVATLEASHKYLSRRIAPLEDRPQPWRRPPAVVVRTPGRRARSRTLSPARRLSAGLNDGYSRQAPARLIRSARITENEVDAEPSLRAPSSLLE